LKISTASPLRKRSPQPSTPGELLDKPLHLMQIKHPVYNPDGLDYSENCGPTSLAMSLNRLNLQPRAYRSQSGTQAMIDAARFAMFSDDKGYSINPDKDGVVTLEDGSAGPRAEEEHLTLTNLVDVERGAENSGATSWRLHSLDEADLALQQGHPIMLAGNPHLPGAYGKRFGLEYDGGHFISVSDIDADKGCYIINDPLIAEAGAKVTKGELKSFLAADIFENTIGLAFEANESWS